MRWNILLRHDAEHNKIAKSINEIKGTESDGAKSAKQHMSHDKFSRVTTGWLLRASLWVGYGQKYYFESDRVGTNRVSCGGMGGCVTASGRIM